MRAAAAPAPRRGWVRPGLSPATSSSVTARPGGSLLADLRARPDHDEGRAGGPQPAEDGDELRERQADAAERRPAGARVQKDPGAAAGNDGVAVEADDRQVAVRGRRAGHVL